MLTMTRPNNPDEFEKGRADNYPKVVGEGFGEVLKKVEEGFDNKYPEFEKRILGHNLITDGRIKRRKIKNECKDFVGSFDPDFIYPAFLLRKLRLEVNNTIQKYRGYVKSDNVEKISQTLPSSMDNGFHLILQKIMIFKNIDNLYLDEKEKRKRREEKKRG